ncbi:Sin3 associated polypeptide p18-domain-containing protein [Pseudomassariella vexata]|uniref:Sin3 associated polypeptide p18-domain-containing protein n=1 Tax=Pseudomassariella vexata TaxID=1141098 RepID=A0A1Y2EEQ3_9PEZI|nr:Sin3 associated polypeptide p18-domain-containing protein [Pseudomassariella vexata]ORY70052.1 Sin3 associated polypeptide p18-domain-containing protein [Pseudomassariella vexata]
MDRHATPPFSLRLVYRTGAFHRPDEFTDIALPPHITIHTWSDCTLTELSHHLAAASPPLLPEPAIGTRLAFRLIFPDTRNASQIPRYLVKDLGSVVLGDGGPGLDPSDVAAEKQLEGADAAKTLSDARFVVGDFVSVAILPPLSDGSVAPATSARMGRGVGAGEARAIVGVSPIVASARDRDRDREMDTQIGFGMRTGRGRGRGGIDGFGRGRGFPEGEWRRGERLPDAPIRARGRGRF